MNSYKAGVFFAGVFSLTLLSSCAAMGLVTLDARVRHSPIHPDGPIYAVIVMEDGKRYTIMPKEKEKEIRGISDLREYPIRFTVRFCKEKRGYGFMHVDGTVTPIAWEIIDLHTGKPIKNHKLRKPLWRGLLGL
jgi:hypothetical protein